MGYEVDNNVNFVCLWNYSYTKLCPLSPVIQTKESEQSARLTCREIIVLYLIQGPEAYLSSGLPLTLDPLNDTYYFIF